MRFLNLNSFKIITFITFILFSLPVYGLCNKELANKYWRTISNNDLSAVQQLLDNHPDNSINVRGKDRMTPLMHASYYGDYDIARILIERGADVNARNIRGETPLMMAAFGGGRQMAQLLLDNGAELNVRERWGQSALMFAIRSDSYELAIELVKRGAAVNVRNRATLETPLLLIARDVKNAKAYELFKLLLEKGAKVNVLDSYGETPLGLVVGERYEAVKELLKYNAKVDYGFINKPIKMAYYRKDYRSAKLLIDSDVNVMGRRLGGTELMLAAIRNDIVRVYELLEAGVKVDEEDVFENSALYFAAGLGHLDVMKILIEYGADVNNVTEYNRSILMFNARDNQVEAARYLISHGADVNAIDSNHHSALMFAVQENDFEMVKLLVESGANLENRDKTTNLSVLRLAIRKKYNLIAKFLIDNGVKVDGEAGTYPPIISASGNGNIEILKLLIEHGADVHKINKYGETAATIAASELELEALKILLHYNPDLNLVDYVGGTPVIDVCSINKGSGSPSEIIKYKYKERFEIVKLLLENGADFNIVDAYGTSALMEACYSGHVDIVKLLLENGAILNTRNQGGKTALTYAKEGLHYELVEFLIEQGAIE